MNKIVNKSLLNGDKFMPEMHLKQRRFTYSAGGSSLKSLKIKTESKNLCRLEIQSLFTEIILIKLVFNVIRFMANQKI